MRMIWIVSMTPFLGICAVAQAQATKPTPPGAVSEQATSLTATCVLRITCEPGLLPAGTYMPIEYLLRSGVILRAKAKTLPDRQLTGYNMQGVGGDRGAPLANGSPPDQAGQDFENNSLALEPARQNVIIVALWVTFTTPLQPEESSRFTEAIREDLQSVLRKMQDAEIERLLQGLKQAEKRVEETRVRLAELQKRRAALISEAGYSDVSQEFVLELARNIEKERQETALKVERLRFRQEAIQRRMADIAAETKDPAKLDSPVVQAYKAKLEALQRELELRKEQAKSGMIPNADVARQEAVVAQAKAELQERLTEVVKSMGGERLAELNKELSSISLDLAEAQARAAALDKRSDQMKKAVALSDQYETQIGMEMPSAKAAYESAQRRCQYLRDRFESLQPPTVSVYGR